MAQIFVPGLCRFVKFAVQVGHDGVDEVAGKGVVFGEKVLRAVGLEDAAEFVGSFQLSAETEGGAHVVPYGSVQLVLLDDVGHLGL